LGRVDAQLAGEAEPPGVGDVGAQYVDVSYGGGDSVDRRTYARRGRGDDQPGAGVGQCVWSS